jgi:hypothetical protein
VRGAKEYPDNGVGGPLHLISLATGEDRVVAEAARSTFENRAVVWRSPSELVYINAQGITRTLRIDNGDGRRLIREAPEKQAWLMDATLNWATANAPTFSVFDEAGLEVLPRTALSGCQAYFSHDGRWGFWVGGAGGPLRAMDLSTRQSLKILEKNDSRLPDGLGYLYFPMLSRDGRLFAVAASRGEHDHFRSDYDVFVMETDPLTFEVLGPVVRMTRHPATDRYPDVFAAPSPLGVHRGEVPFEVAFEGDGGEGWIWDFGDGGAAEGGTARHRYERPGRYGVKAQRNGEELAGRVIALEPESPRLLSATVSGDAMAVALRFDEEIAVADATVRFESTRAVAGRRVSADATTLIVELVEPFTGIDRAIVSGVEDLAQVPNRLTEAEIEVGPPLWPVRREGLEFVWQTADAANLVRDEESGLDRAISLQSAGRARLDSSFSMLLGAGSFRAADEDAARLFRALKSTNELTIEMVVGAAPGGRSEKGARRLVTFADGRRQNFRLELDGDTLLFRMRGASKGPRANLRIAMFELPPDRDNHVVVTYSPGELNGYLNGEKRAEVLPPRIRGDFFHWRSLPLVFGGDELSGDRRLEGVALYRRVLSREEVEANHLRYRGDLGRRDPVERSTVRAKLVRKSAPPTLAQISPYTEALAVFEYDVVEVLSGSLPTGKTRVAHWALLDGGRLAINDRTPGESYVLAVEPFAANRQLESLFLAADEVMGSGGILYYAPDPRP